MEQSKGNRQSILSRLFSPYFLSSSAGRRAALLGIFIALSLVANMFSIDFSPSQKLSFTYLVAFFAGTYFGGIPGFLILFLGDFLGFLLNAGGGVYWLPTGIATGLLALIPGIVMNVVRFSFRGGVFVKAAISVSFMFLFVTCGVGAAANYWYVKTVVYAGREYSKLFTAYLAGKISFAAIVSGVNYALVFVLIPILNKLKAFPLKIK